MKKMLMLLAVAFLIAAVTGVSFGMTKAEAFKGYLSDVYCATKGIAVDGANLKTEPEKHTVACMLAPPCMASGYGLEINEGTAMAKNYVFYKFDQKGTDLAAKMLKGTKKKNAIYVEVKGIKEKDMIKVDSISEIKMK